MKKVKKMEKMFLKKFTSTLYSQRKEKIPYNLWKSKYMKSKTNIFK